VFKSGSYLRPVPKAMPGPPGLAGIMHDIELTNDEYDKFCGLIYRAAGIRIADNKRVMVSNRVRRRLRATGIASFSDYFTFLTSNAGAAEMPSFLDAITTNETYFFRDPHHYDWLGDTFFPEIAHASGRKLSKRVRIWSAACSTGEEPYSIALKMFARWSIFRTWKTTILGTDLSGEALTAARAARYDARAVKLIDPVALKTFFREDQQAKRWIAGAELKERVTWKQHNLLFPLEEDPFDCIFIKNVLIYFDKESKQTAVRNLLEALSVGGYLVVGPTEGIHMMLDPLKRLSPWLYQKPG
jgi:chemotaxis protein methyltransferase CheR